MARKRIISSMNFANPFSLLWERYFPSGPIVTLSCSYPYPWWWDKGNKVDKAGLCAVKLSQHSTDLLPYPLLDLSQNLNQFFSNQLRKIGLDAVFNYRSYIGLFKNSQKYYKMPLQAPFVESSLILIINLDLSEGCCFILNRTEILDSPLLHFFHIFHIMCVYIAPCHFFSA